MESLQGCPHTGHLFDHWRCSELSVQQKVVTVAFHILTACIPLFIYYCWQWGHVLFSTEDIASLEERKPSVVEEVPTSASEGCFEEADGSIDTSQYKAPDQEQGPPGRSLADIASESLQSLVNLRVIEVQEEGLEERGALTLWDPRVLQRLVQQDTQKIIPRSTIFKAATQVVEHHKKITWIEGLFDEVIHGVLACVEGVDPYDWFELGVDVCDENAESVTLFSPSSKSSQLEEGDCFIYQKPIPVEISQMMTVFLQRYEEFKKHITPEVNKTKLMSGYLPIQNAYELIRIAFVMGTSMLEDFEQSYAEETKDEDKVSLLTDRGMYFFHILSLFGRLYHQIRAQAYFKEGRVHIPKDPPKDDWSDQFYQNPDKWSSSHTRMRILYNQFCKELYEFLGEENWEEFQQKHEVARYYLLDLSMQKYVHPGQLFG